jgi:hypothetical protein
MLPPLNRAGETPGNRFCDHGVVYVESLIIWLVMVYQQFNSTFGRPVAASPSVILITHNRTARHGWRILRV